MGEKPDKKSTDEQAVSLSCLNSVLQPPLPCTEEEAMDLHSTPSDCYYWNCAFFRDASSWNGTLRAFGYELLEKDPGVLCLRTIPHASVVMTRGKAQRAMSPINSLLTRHACVEDVAVSMESLASEMTFEPLPCIHVSFNTRHVRARNRLHSLYHEVDSSIEVRRCSRLTKG